MVAGFRILKEDGFASPIAVVVQIGIWYKFHHADHPSLPDVLQDWVEAQALRAHDGDPSGYLRDLIRQDRDRAETLAAIQQDLKEGFESGISNRPMGDILASARKQAGVRSTP